jgi:hypothetical protein
LFGLRVVEAQNDLAQAIDGQISGLDESLLEAAIKERRDAIAACWRRSNVSRAGFNEREAA